VSGKREDARRVPHLGSAFLLSLLLVGLCQTSTGGQARRTVFSRTGEASFGTQDASSIKFTSDVYADLTVRCWERPQLHVAWTIEAAPGEDGGRRTAGEKAEETFEKEIKVSAEEVGGVISVRAQANPSRFSAVTLPGETPGSKVTRLEDSATGLSWSLRLTAFVPYGSRLDSRQFRGETFVACGGSRAAR
jgi:hypothetical protein